MESLGLSKYVQVLKQQDLNDPEALALLTDDDLKDMQVDLLYRVYCIFCLTAYMSVLVFVASKCHVNFSGGYTVFT